MAPKSGTMLIMKCNHTFAGLKKFQILPESENDVTKVRPAKSPYYPTNRWYFDLLHSNLKQHLMDRRLGARERHPTPLLRIFFFIFFITILVSTLTKRKLC